MDCAFGVLLSLDMLYPQIISHCIDDDMTDIDGETMFRSSVGALVLWIVHSLYCYLWICCIHI